ncbi:hypothetical protein [Aquimarina litoralis]|uniref:hypothetical protein n=1 Tax=Aquimarina litoralis TaxID=584605 RepID=UPI001C567F30|nr:hypothetical protein [Aquimarina litoralis]MBW1297206.1 hypothetical protein [Aquimarina litoralis]
MKVYTKIVSLAFLFSVFIGHAQSEEKTAETKPKENSSEETVTKTIRIKGANGEEKIITEQQIITKKSELQLNPDEEDEDTNRTAVYSPQEVSIKNAGKTSSEKLYSSIPNGSGFIFTIIDENGEKMLKARPLSNGYYLVNFGGNNNSLGHFDESKNLILETYDATSDSIVSSSYKLKQL